MKRVVKIVLSWLLIICIPAISLGISTNILVRLPDLYQFQMNASQNLSSFNAGGQEEKVSQAIGKFMQHREAELQYQYDEEEEMALLFSKSDQETMSNIRWWLDLSAVGILLALIITAIAYILLIRDEHLEALRLRFKESWFLYILGLGALSAGAFLLHIKPAMILDKLAPIEESDLMYSIFSGGFFKYLFITNIVVSLIITLIMMYITWKNTKPKNIFW